MTALHCCRVFPSVVGISNHVETFLDYVSKKCRMCLLLRSCLNLYLNGCGLPRPVAILVSTMWWKEESYYPYITFFLLIFSFFHSTGQQQKMFSLPVSKNVPYIILLVQFFELWVSLCKSSTLLWTYKYQILMWAMFFFSLFMWLISKFLFF